MFNLQAIGDRTTSFLNHIGNDVPSGHDGVLQVTDAQAISVYKGICEIAVVEERFIQGNSSEVSTFKIDGVHTNFHQDSPLKVNTLQTGISHSGTVQISSTEVGIIQLDILQDNIKQVGTAEVGIAQVDTYQTGSFQVRTTEVSATQVDSLHLRTPQADSGEISIPSSITSEQFLSVHNFTPQSIYTINNSDSHTGIISFNPQPPSTLTLLLKTSPTDNSPKHKSLNLTNMDNPSVEGKQRYCCQNPQCPKRTFILSYTYQGCQKEVKRKIPKMAVKGSRIRETARVLKISPHTVMSELKKV